MKKVFLLLIFISTVSIAQNESARSSTIDLTAKGRQINISYKTENVGTPYLYDTWREGFVVILDSVVSQQEKMQVDLQKGELILGLDEGRGTIINDTSVTGFAINKKNNIARHYFVRLNASQFENPESKTQFYEIVSNTGKSNYLIKEVQKYLFDPNKSRGYQTQNNLPDEWKSRTSFYVKNKDGIYIKSKLSKKSILNVLADKSEDVKAFVKAHKLSFNEEYDVVKILDYYYSL